jgi:hypothetical protein
MPIPAKQNGKIVEPGDDPLELYTVHKEHRYRRFAFPHVVQEYVLNILRFLVGHGQILLFLYDSLLKPGFPAVRGTPADQRVPFNRTPSSCKVT